MADRRRTSRIPVHAVLEYRATGMGGYGRCEVLNASTMSLEVRLDTPLARDTVVAVVVRASGSPRPAGRAVGRVRRRERRDDGWFHVITAPDGRPWSPMFLYHVLCSSFESSPWPASGTAGSAAVGRPAGRELQVQGGPSP